MQMGRWFGYRKGYEKLCRIWMSEDSIEWYRHISEATDELREEVKRYEDSRLTPKDFGLRVRSDITTLLVTATNKMRAAEKRTCVISLSGTSIETPEIYSDEEKNHRNIGAVIRFIDTVHMNGYVKEIGKPLIKNVPKEYIIDLIDEIEVSPKNESFNTETIIQFIKDYKGGELDRWDVAFPTGKSSQPFDFGHGIEIHYPTRKYLVVNDGRILKMSGSKRRLGRSSDGALGLDKKNIEDVKARMEKGKTPSQNEYFKNIRRNPLLTVYAVELKGGEGEGAKEYEGKTVFGFGIGIPSLSDHETKYARYVLNKIAIQQMLEGEIDEWDPEEDD